MTPPELPEGMKRYFKVGYEMVPQSDGAWILVSDLPKLREHHRQEMREELIEELLGDERPLERFAFDGKWLQAALDVITEGDAPCAGCELPALREKADQRDKLLSAIKQHRNATESRLRLLAAGARQPESSDLMLKPDRDLYQLADSIEQGKPQ